MRVLDVALSAVRMASSGHLIAARQCSFIAVRLAPFRSSVSSRAGGMRPHCTESLPDKQGGMVIALSAIATFDSWQLDTYTGSDSLQARDHDESQTRRGRSTMLEDAQRRSRGSTRGERTCPQAQEDASRMLQEESGSHALVLALVTSQSR